MHRETLGLVLLILLTACGNDSRLTEPEVAPAMEIAASPVAPPTEIVTTAGFPLGTTLFVDVANTTGVEDGTMARPFNTIEEGLAVAKNGDVVGVAAGLYSLSGPGLVAKYAIDGLQNFTLAGMGPLHTIVRGDRTSRLIVVRNGASALIKGFTFENGGHRNADGGGIWVSGHVAPSTLTVEDVVLRRNLATNGGAIAASGDVHLQLVNVVMANNVANNCCGAVVLAGTNHNVTGTFTNITVTENMANFLVGGILAERATLSITNSIVWNNSLKEVDTFFGEGSVTVSFSDIGDALFPGLGNIFADPHFSDPAAQDYRLQSSSPAIDAGTSTGAPATDLDGKVRPIDGDGDGNPLFDMGAFEFGIASPPDNRPPFLTIDADSVVVEEAQVARNTGTVGDPNGDPVALTASAGVVTNNNDGTWSWSLATADGPSESQIVTIGADDGKGGTAQSAFLLIVNNVAPTVAALAGATIQVSQIYLENGSFADPGADSWSATVDYGDGAGAQALTLVGMTFSLSHAYTTSGVFNIDVVVADSDGGMGSTSTTITVLSVDDLISILQSDISALVGAGILNRGQGNSLVRKLDQVERSFGRGNANAALNQLSAFVNQVNGLVNGGVIEPGEGAALIASADGITAAVEATP